MDRNKLAIRGSSAGGFTTLCGLTFSDVFRAGACYYGISDLGALAASTHKFESHYVKRLVASGETLDLTFRARSPIYHYEKISCPVILFQGLQDKVVPPDQAEMMVAALRQTRVPVAYLTFADESHGFRNGKNSRRALEAEIVFYSRVFAFELADPLPEIEIENFPDNGGV